MAATSIFGTKIFITYGEHDMADNIVAPGAGTRGRARPEGVKGISLFVCAEVPGQAKTGRWARATMCSASASNISWASRPAPRRCCSTATHGAGAVGYLVGQENRGLEYMFIMMNAARYAVGVQGIAIAERAYQKAVAVRARPCAELARWMAALNKQRPDHPSPRREAAC